MTRYYVLKTKYDKLFDYGSLYYSTSKKAPGKKLLLSQEISLSHSISVIIPQSLLLEISKSDYEAIQNSPLDKREQVVNEVIQTTTSTKKGVFRKGITVSSSGEEMPAIINQEVFVSNPTTEKPNDLSKEDVWGLFNPENMELVHEGMVVSKQGEKCPHFEDVLPSKSVTVVCTEEQEQGVHYWLEYVHGANSVSKRKELNENRIAIRSDYQCW